MNNTIYVHAIVKDSKDRIIKLLKDEKKLILKENKQLKEDKKKAREWVNNHIYKYQCKGITIIDWDELSNPNDLLEILGDKENE